jgi:hypothetical protein
MFHLDDGFFVPILIFAVPIVAIVGGITAGIVKTISRHRIAELAMRERIAAIERGVDPSKLPPAPEMRGGNAEDIAEMVVDRGSGHYSLRRAQGMLVGGVVCTFVGAGLSVFLYLAANGEPGAWAVGLIPGSVGLALLLCAALLWPRGGANPSQPLRMQ